VFQQALDGQDPRAAEQAREAFHQALDGIEGERFL
jgi:hypothetical protein